MSKNITEMSFDEIFPETPFPASGSSSLFNSHSEEDADPFTSDIYDNSNDYNYDDYGTDISSLEEELRKNQFPQYAPEQPVQTFENNDFQPQQQFQPQPQNQFLGNNFDVTVQQNTTSSFGNSGQAYQNTYVPKRNFQNPDKSFVIGIFAFFLTGFPIICIPLAIVGIVSARKEKQAALDKGKPVPPYNKAGRIICTIALVLSCMASASQIINFITSFIH